MLRSLGHWVHPDVGIRVGLNRSMRHSGKMAEGQAEFYFNLPTPLLKADKATKIAKLNMHRQHWQDHVTWCSIPTNPKTRMRAHWELQAYMIIVTVWEEAEGSIQSLTNLKGEESQKSQVMFTGKCCGPREKRKLSARWPWYGLEGLVQSGPCELSELTRTIPTMRRKCREQNPNWVRTSVMAAKERDNLNK